MMPPGPRRRPALLTFGGLVGVIVTFAVSIGLSHTSASGASLTQRRQAVLAYATALEPLAKEGGQVVVLGLKPGIADIEKHSLPGPTLEQMALGWTHELTTVSGKVHALVVPSYLTTVKTGYDESLSLYVDTAQTVLDATRVDGAQRGALIARAVSLGQQADARFDRAKAALDVARTEVGLPAVSSSVAGKGAGSGVTSDALGPGTFGFADRAVKAQSAWLGQTLMAALVLALGAAFVVWRILRGRRLRRRRVLRAWQRDLLTRGI